MVLTDLYIDDVACRAVMRRFRLETKREAVNFALRTLAAEPLNREEAKKMRCIGWVGDLGEMRASRQPTS